jgi:hypothetical protein
VTRCGGQHRRPAPGGGASRWRHASTGTSSMPLALRKPLTLALGRATPRQWGAPGGRARPGMRVRDTLRRAWLRCPGVRRHHGQRACRGYPPSAPGTHAPHPARSCIHTGEPLPSFTTLLREFYGAFMTCRGLGVRISRVTAGDAWGSGRLRRGSVHTSSRAGDRAGVPAPMRREDLALATRTGSAGACRGWTPVDRAGSAGPCMARRRRHICQSAHPAVTCISC